MQRTSWRFTNTLCVAAGEYARQAPPLRLSKPPPRPCVLPCDLDEDTVVHQATTSLLVFALAALTAACRDDACPDGRAPTMGRCPPTPDGGAEAGDGDVITDAAACEAECTGNTPVCHGATGQCVQCVKSDDCSAGVCEIASGQCVGCLQDGDCTEAGVGKCDTASKTCVECLAHTDCADASRPACGQDFTCGNCDPAGTGGEAAVAP